jgi:hypothetical protein
MQIFNVSNAIQLALNVFMVVMIEMELLLTIQSRWIFFLKLFKPNNIIITFCFVLFAWVIQFTFLQSIILSVLDVEIIVISVNI